MGQKGRYSTDHHEDTMPLRYKGGTTTEQYERETETYESIRRRTRMRYKCIRITLGIFLILTILVALAFMAIGLLPLISYYTTYRQLSFMFNFIYAFISATGFIILGFVLLIVCVIGVIAVLKISRCLLNAFAIGLAIVSVVAILGGVLFIIFKNQVGVLSIRKDNLTDAIVTRYGYNTDTNSTNKLVTDVIDFMQETFECCGSYGNVSDELSWGIYKTESAWYINAGHVHPMVPESCCVKGDDLESCQGKPRMSGPPVRGPGKFQDKSRYENDKLHKNGCYDMILKNSGKYVFLFGIALAASAVIPLIAMGISFCLGCFIYRDRYY